jgi:restriction system protein
MAIPDFQSCMLPLLQLASDGGEHRVAEASKVLATQFKLTDEELAEQLPSGRAPLFYNRVAWAIFHLRKSGLLTTPRRAYFTISDLGRSVLDRAPAKVNLGTLAGLDGGSDGALGLGTQPAHATADGSASPREALGRAYLQLRSELVSELSEVLSKTDPVQFERIVVELLVKMGYGGNVTDASRAIRKSGDEGIDGVIKEDHLGLDNIYVQAKRWQGVVGRPEIQKFAGALQGQRAKKGIFITTSTFTNGAQEYVDRIDNRIVLIDGDQLCNLMIDFDVGVNRAEYFEIKRVDLDFFLEP